MHINIRQNGVDLPSVQHEGQRWLLAPPEGEYQIVLYNNSSERRLAVVTVDGLSVLDGEDGSREGNGYVLEPWQTMVIKGWRRSDRAAAAFTFTPNEGSYPAKMGKGTRNTGVIAVAVFDEKVELKIDPVVIQRIIEQPVIVQRPIFVDPYPYRPWYPYGPRIVWGSNTSGMSGVIGAASVTTNNAVHDGSEPELIACSASLSAEPTSAKVSVQELAQMDLGTAYGREVEMKTHTTTFTRASDKPVLEVVIRYGTKERLATLGVPVEQAKAPSAPAPAPNPFPGSSCPAPAGWSG